MSKYIQSAGGTQPGKPWIGTPRIACDICHATDLDCFVDGATTQGPWAIMCPSCHKTHGKGTGPGLGQRYCKEGAQ